jgi:hypothetical protein
MSSSRDVLRLVDCVGDGYAVSTTAELEFIQRVAEQTGVVLDPVYSGKVRGGELGKDTAPGVHTNINSLPSSPPPHHPATTPRHPWTRRRLGCAKTYNSGLFKQAGGSSFCTLEVSE